MLVIHFYDVSKWIPNHAFQLSIFAIDMTLKRPVLNMHNS